LLLEPPPSPPPPLLLSLSLKMSSVDRTAAECSKKCGAESKTTQYNRASVNHTRWLLLLRPHALGSMQMMSGGLHLISCKPYAGLYLPPACGRKRQSSEGQMQSLTKHVDRN
jgi:hypothetical protein